MSEYERIRTCGVDIPMEMYEEAARTDKYIATAKPVIHTIATVLVTLIISGDVSNA